MYDLIMVRYGEMTLKKKNYFQFQKQANMEIRHKLASFTALKFEEVPYRFYIFLNGEDSEAVIERLNTVAGLHSYSLCVKCRPDYDEIATKGYELLKDVVAPYSFKVETKRSNKEFPATSIEISKAVAQRILPKLPDSVTVDVHHPEYQLDVEVRNEGTYISLGDIPGMGGLPASSAGTGLLMISGGIDSPVAAYLALRKGIKLTALHFAAPPYTSPMALQKVRDLLAVLSQYAPNEEIELLVVPFTKVEDLIHEKAKETYMITLLRRCMYRIAQKVCDSRDLMCIVNGESIGQVASQTLESMNVISRMASTPIIRPLATNDKEEVITIARKIKTYDISVEPYEDCCTVFVPEHPVIKPTVKEAEYQENLCEGLLDLVDEAYENITADYIHPDGNSTVFDAMAASYVCPFKK